MAAFTSKKTGNKDGDLKEYSMALPGVKKREWKATHSRKLDTKRTERENEPKLKGNKELL